MNRAYQQDAIDCCVSSQQNTNVVKMFCGSGKTRVMIKTFIKMKSKYGCFVFPSIALITQFNNDYGSKYFENFCILNVCSKNEIGSEHSFTTEPDEINTFIKNNKKKVFKHLLIHAKN